MTHYELPRTQRFLFQVKKKLTAHYELPKTHCFLFQAKNIDGALWIAKDPTVLI